MKNKDYFKSGLYATDPPTANTMLKYEVTTEDLVDFFYDCRKLFARDDWTKEDFRNFFKNLENKN